MDFVHFCPGALWADTQTVSFGARFTMVGWRAAGINYVRFSQIAAQVTRNCTKNAKKAPSATLKITAWKDGKPIKAAKTD
ncbi:unnamed protein product, partial [Mesorhabditis spiculigera]